MGHHAHAFILVQSCLLFRFMNNEQISTEVIMGTIRQGKGLVVILMTLVGCLLLFCAFFVSYETSSPAVSVDETLLIQGVVRRVLPGEK